jgi:outer membrane receptor for ferrienterochelin and colicins
MWMVRFLGFILFIFFSINASFSQNGTVKGTIKAEGEYVFGATTLVQGLNLGAVSDIYGQFSINNIPPGKHTLQISYIGYQTITKPIEVAAGQELSIELELFPDYLQLNETVVTGNRREVPVHNAPVIISRIDNRLFISTQSLSLGEGLNFSPGLRLENNCQNCGFTQLRMNGLNGPYTQILINSRPIFSALTGVYGLDMIPANMIDRVEVVRGGGSALYGGNAIAGIVNVLTRQPIRNSFEAGINYGFTDLNTPDRTLTANGSVVSKEIDKGLSIFAYNRNRQDWDKDGDGFTELTRLKNTTFGLDGFIKKGDRGQIKLNTFIINEFRRGGSMEDLPPHQTILAEQLEHNITGGALSWEQMSANLKHKIALYTSAQQTNRDSYYGAGGRVLEEGDSLTEEDLIALNAYGTSKGISMVGGVQYSFDIHPRWLVMAGSEVQFNKVNDKMPGYNRSINQQVLSAGNYAQLEIKPIDPITVLLGGRLDFVKIKGDYDLDASRFRQERLLPVAVPRISVMYQALPYLQIRAAFAQGYRAPQAFDEDLHIETVGGAARFIRLSEDLKTERSNSLTASVNYTLTEGRIQINWLTEGFYTYLKDPFIIANQEELPGGIIALTKRNGTGAVVKGINSELSLAFSRKFNFQTGATLQNARYREEETIWEPEQPEDGNTLTTKNIVRTPNVYGFLTLNYQPVESFKINLSGVATGKMDVPHMIDPETGQTVMKTSSPFMEVNIRLSYHQVIKGDTHLEFIAGMQNIFNSFQNDFDRGPLRDASYVYGPSRPRTLFVGMKFGLH